MKTDVILFAAATSKHDFYAPAAKIRGKTILHHLEKKLQQNPNVGDIIIVGGYHFSELKSDELSSRIVKNKQYQVGGFCSSLKLGLKYIKTDSVMLVHGDIWCKNLNWSRILKSKYSAVISTRCKKMKQTEIGLQLLNNKIISFGWRQKDKWGKIAYIAPHDLNTVHKILQCPHTNNWFPFEVLLKMVQQNITIVSYDHTDELLDIDCYQDLRKISL